MTSSLDTLTIRGFKSIKEVIDFELKELNVIIGGNGAGKSNLISFFRMLRALIDGNLSRYVKDNGGAGDILFNGRKVTATMEFEMRFGSRGFRFKLAPTPGNALAIEDEARFYSASGWWLLGDSEDTSSLMVKEVMMKQKDAHYSKPVYDAISSWQIYHFHDTSSTAAMRNYEIVQDSKVLRSDAANIAPFLLKLKQKHAKEYQEILNAICLVAPFFENFILEPQESGAKKEVNLSWTQKGSDYPMQPYHLSDGSIRFICLATALLQPNPPATIIIDEPELGLHPAAIAILAELIQVAAKQTQVIVATQSPALIDQFGIEDIVVVNRENGASTFKRLKEQDFTGSNAQYSTHGLNASNPLFENTYEIQIQSSALSNQLG